MRLLFLFSENNIDGIYILQLNEEKITIPHAVSCDVYEVTSAYVSYIINYLMNDIYICLFVYI